jgi:hypothetical protein
MTGSTLSQFVNPAPLIQSPYLVNLKKLELCGEDDNGHLDGAGIRALVATRYLEQLESLDLGYNWFEPDDFVPFLTAKNLPGLRNLHLRNASIEDEVAVSLAATPWMSQLKTLDLSSNCIGERGCRAILESPFFEKIETLDLRRSLNFELDDQPRASEDTLRSLAEQFGSRILL